RSRRSRARSAPRSSSHAPARTRASPSPAEHRPPVRSARDPSDKDNRPVPATRSPRVVLAAASAAQAAVSFVNFGLPSIGPDLRSHYGLSLPELGAVLTAALLGSGVTLMGAGVAVDRIGARRTTFAGSMLAAAGLAAAAASESKGLLFVALVVSGIG